MGISSVNVWINVWEIVFWWSMNEEEEKDKNHGHMNEKKKTQKKELWIWKQMADDWDLFWV